MKEKAFISIVLYACNNEGQIGESLLSLDRFMDERFENFEIVIINDFSTDGTLSEIKQAYDRLSRDITIINLAWRHGPERGVIAGVDMVIGDFVVEMDMNRMDYSPDLISNLFAEAGKGFDVVSASRKTGQKISDAIFFNVFNRITYLPFDVVNESARIISRRAINAILDMNERVVYRGILYKYSGFPSKTITYQPVAGARYRGMSFADKTKLATDVLVSYSNIGTNVSVIFAMFFMAVSIAVTLYAVLVNFTLNEVVPGWTTTVLIMSICFFGVFSVLALQGRYISSLMHDIKGRPTYVVRAIERSSRQDGNK